MTLDKKTLHGFHFERSLKTGSLCEVHLVSSPVHGRKLVLKALKPEIFLDSVSGKTLQYEASILADLHHPNIVTFVDFVKDRAGARLLTDYAGGMNLSELVESRGRLSPKAVAHIGLELARGLAYLHQRGVVHGMLDPSNVLCTEHGTVQICDFGHAVLSGAKAQLAGRTSRANAAQRRYQAPEQNLGAAFDERADYYVLGILLFHLLAGQPPEGEPGRNHVRGAARSRGPSVLPLAPTTPRALAELIAWLLAEDVDARPLHATSIVETLAKLIDREGYGDRSTALGEVFRGGRAELAAGTRPVRKFGEWRGFAAIAVAFLALGVTLQACAGQKAGFDDLGATPLPMRPSKAGYLRVVAQPWAEVWVDGQLVETTPFLKPVALAEGPHFVTLKHPAAAEDRREILIRSGETMMLEVRFEPNVDADAGPLRPVHDAGLGNTPSHNPNVPRLKLTR
jgi:eukaryotic-like serine/threonine-protein kinase